MEERRSCQLPGQNGSSALELASSATPLPAPRVVLLLFLFSMLPLSRSESQVDRVEADTLTAQHSPSQVTEQMAPSNGSHWPLLN